MNSHQRRTNDRFWPHGIFVETNALDDVLDWLTETFGSCSSKTRKMPRWCYRPEYIPSRGNFVMHQHGASIYFRKEKDYAMFLLKWEN